MSRKFFCAKCKSLLTVTRRVLASKTIVDLIEPHECSGEMEFDEGYAKTIVGEVKTVQNSNGLSQPLPPGDKRAKEYVKADTTAPLGVLDQLDNLKRG